MIITVNELYEQYGYIPRFYKIFNPTEKYFNIEYNTGFNNIDGYIGTHFYSEDQLHNVLIYEDNPYYIRELFLHEDSLIDIVGWNLRTNIFTLSEKEVLSSFFVKNIKILKKNGLLLEYIKPEHQTFEICSICVSQNGLALCYVFNKTFELCCQAIDNNGMALPYVKEDFLTDIIYLKSIHSSYGRSLSIIPDNKQTYEMCKDAVILSGVNLFYVSKKFDPKTILIEAIKKNPYCFIFTPTSYHSMELYEVVVDIAPVLLSFISTQNEKMCLNAVKKDGLSLKYVIDKTYKICLEAVIQNGLALEFVDKDNKTYELCKNAISQNGLAIKFYDYESLELCKIAINNNPESIAYMTQTYELNLLAVTKNGKVIKYITNPTPEICKIASTGGATWYDIKNAIKINNNYIKNG